MWNPVRDYDKIWKAKRILEQKGFKRIRLHGFYSGSDYSNGKFIVSVSTVCGISSSRIIDNGNL